MSATPYTYTLSPLAYALPLLHAARYTSNTVLGLLLGSVNGSEVVIDDALPLLHNYTSLSPMAEVGLSLAQEEAKRRGGTVVGVYVVHELEVTGLGRVGERILEGLKKGLEGAIGMTVSCCSERDHCRVVPDCDGMAIVLPGYRCQRWAG